MAIWMCLFPVSLFISSISTFVVSYTIAVTKNHTDAFLPYISDTATTPPECCIFGLMSFIAALASVGTMYGQYKFNSTRIQQNEGTRCLKVLNQVAFVIGLLSCLGMCIVATFQVTIIELFHRVGAVMFFLAGVIYISMQTGISRHGCCAAMFCFRLLTAIIAAMALLSICISLVESSQKHWTGNEKDYGLHIAGAVCEWVVALCFVIHFGTYCCEFKDFTITVTANFGNSYEQLGQ